ncbi:MAG TPA: lysyl oxidase family protein [Pyrinomonadaceae bacterium]|nr:lysyl oxidase family protein [Pyrinomonadaceae bacterium]
MSKTRSLFILLGLCIALGISWLAYTPKGKATLANGPNLVVREDVLGSQWVVRDENISATACSAIEGDVTPGLRTLVRFTVMTPNIGNQDIFVGDPNAHVAANDGLFEFATCHHHYHFRHYALYELVDPRTGQVWRAAKRGFCMLDTDPVPNSISGFPPKEGQFHSCGAIGVPGNQGISVGWADTYRFTLAGQYFVLDGGDGQPVVPPGNYIIRITVNPPFVAKKGEPCPNVDPNGFCHQLPESNYNDNVGTAQISIPDHPGRQGVGPLAGNTDATVECDHGCTP